MRGEAVAMLADQRAALLRLLAEVDDPTWDRPTVCAPWSVKDVVAHLVEGEINVGRVYRGEVISLGRIDPDEGIARWSALPGEAVRAALWQHGSATQRVLDQLDDERWSSPIDAYGCSTVGRLVRLHLFEALVHGHDLTRAIDAPPIWGSRIGFAVSFVLRAAPATLTRRRIEARGALRVEVADTAWTIAGRSDGGWSAGSAGEPAERADASIQIDPETLVLAVTGRLAIGEALAGAQVSGDAEAASRILNGWQVLAPA